jgi:ubiquinone/menaquinone biosynthesis C-methylase UbiE
VLLPNDVDNLMILETGSGTSRVSLRLAKEGANLHLLDISLNALRSSKWLFKRAGISAEFINADIENLPFKNNIFDVTWSSGVLEHYNSHQIKFVLRDSFRITRKKGRVICIVPNRDAKIYNFGRKLQLVQGIWKYGPEHPQTTSELSSFISKPESMKSAGFIFQFRFIMFPAIGFIIRFVVDFLLKKSKFARDVDEMYPGYLLGAIWIK